MCLRGGVPLSLSNVREQLTPVFEESILNNPSITQRYENTGSSKHGLRPDSSAAFSAVTRWSS